MTATSDFARVRGFDGYPHGHPILFSSAHNSRPGLHPNQHTGSATYDAHTRRQSNGGRSLKPEALERHRAETAIYHALIYGEEK